MLFQGKAGDAYLRPGKPEIDDPRQYRTEEQVAGFQNARTKKFTEIMLIRTSTDLEKFHRFHGIGGEGICTGY